MFQGFGDILNLVPLAENVIKLSAVCMTCNSDGHFTKRMTKETSVSNFLSSQRNRHGWYFVNSLGIIFHISPFDSLMSIHHVFMETCGKLSFNYQQMSSFCCIQDRVFCDFHWCSQILPCTPLSNPWKKDL